MQLPLQPKTSIPTKHSMIASKQINIDHRRVWLFYNEIRAVAQCPYDWGVGSAFHPMKIHIQDAYAMKQAIFKYKTRTQSVL